MSRKQTDKMAKVSKSRKAIDLFIATLALIAIGYFMYSTREIHKAYNDFPEKSNYSKVVPEPHDYFVSLKSK
ncbi:MAG: hypothetical protein A2W91_20115 [Bacteroidetes bacterium GWF2_38_335]|nr:MAG: hypothetical protein A2W91_20115 [Bacteroidetes bacterium GWF2_38_335]OFY81976.1 MAG: hypothetical protein A2281_09805 [Bacteroidetes bacterium RIFOXYA12_FULL_38_20]HBS86526.1 hypothetical protein [Bacteroidales bacterium]